MWIWWKGGGNGSRITHFKKGYIEKPWTVLLYLENNNNNKNVLKVPGKGYLKKAWSNFWDILFSVAVKTFQNGILKLLPEYLFAEKQKKTKFSRKIFMEKRSTIPRFHTTWYMIPAHQIIFADNFGELLK